MTGYEQSSKGGWGNSPHFLKHPPQMKIPKGKFLLYNVLKVLQNAEVPTNIFSKSPPNFTNYMCQLKKCYSPSSLEWTRLLWISSYIKQSLASLKKIVSFLLFCVCESTNITFFKHSALRGVLLNPKSHIRKVFSEFLLPTLMPS